MQQTAKKIIELRQSQDKTQKELADFLGVKVQCVSNWENGKRRISIEYLRKIAEFFNVSINSLTGYDDKQLAAEEEKQELGKDFLQVRQNLNKTQKELADFVGVSTSTVSKWEQGISTPTVIDFFKIMSLQARELTKKQEEVAELEKTVNSVENEILELLRQVPTEKLEQILELMAAIINSD